MSRGALICTWIDQDAPGRYRSRPRRHHSGSRAVRNWCRSRWRDRERLDRFRYSARCEAGGGDALPRIAGVKFEFSPTDCRRARLAAPEPPNQPTRASSTSFDRFDVGREAFRKIRGGPPATIPINSMHRCTPDPSHAFWQLFDPRPC